MTKGNGVGALKILALWSAVALGGGYVWVTQQNAEKKRTEARDEQERTVLPGSKNPWISSDAKEFKEVKVSDLSNWSDADSIRPIPEGDEKRTILPGSKVGWIVPPESDEEKEPEERTVLPGSKSIDWILPPPSPEKEEP